MRYGYYGYYSQPTSSQPMTVGAWATIGILLFLLICCCVVAVIVARNQQRGQPPTPPPWWRERWDAEERPWRPRPKGGSGHRPETGSRSEERELCAPIYSSSPTTATTKTK